MIGGKSIQKDKKMEVDHDVRNPIQVGSRVTLEVDSGTQVYEIVADSADTGQSVGKITASSQMGQLLIGRHPGEEIEVIVEEMPKKYKILSVE